MQRTAKGHWLKTGCRAHALLLLAAFIVPAISSAEVYKYVDEDGIITYTNIEPARDVSYVTMKFPCYASQSDCRKIKWEDVPLNTQAFETQIRSAAVYNAVDESLVRAIIHAESAYHPDAVSPAGAQGLMQLMPATQQQLNVSNPFNPAHNIAGGVRHLSDLLEEFDGSVRLAAAAYNAGSGAVRKHGGIPPYSETQEYVRRVQILYRRYQDALRGS